jgi:hypothetical protein
MVFDYGVYIRVEVDQFMRHGLAYLSKLDGVALEMISKFGMAENMSE